ncbi:hypothetical protein BCAR13_1540012 [Paraburkholderia caribensis]|nr:hypothetical protein BCAR13_1540012 [Paraburkholderia caribensis]
MSTQKKPVSRGYGHTGITSATLCLMALMRLAAPQVVPDIAHLRRMSSPGVMAKLHRQAAGPADDVSDAHLVRGRMRPRRHVVSLAVGPRANVARDIAAQVAARRRWREILVARFRLLPRLKRGRLLRPPVPALRSLLRECRRGEQ